MGGADKVRGRAALGAIASAWPLRFDPSLPGVEDTAYVSARDTVWRPMYEPNEADTLNPPSDPWVCANNEPKRELYSDPAKDTDRVRTGDALARVRAGLRARLASSPLLDAPAFARDVEAAFRDMWRQWCASPGPRAGACRE